MYLAGYTYPDYLDVSQFPNVSYMLCYIPREYMYLDILHVSQRSPGYIFWAYTHTHVQIHQDTCILCASLMSHWIHIRIHQDTCILDASSRYIKIHRDTKSRYMYLGRVMTTLQDTIRIHHAISFGGLLPVALLTEPTGCLIKR